MHKPEVKAGGIAKACGKVGSIFGVEGGLSAELTAIKYEGKIVNYRLQRPTYSSYIVTQDTKIGYHQLGGLDIDLSAELQFGFMAQEWDSTTGKLSDVELLGFDLFKKKVGTRVKGGELYAEGNFKGASAGGKIGYTKKNNFR